MRYTPDMPASLPAQLAALTTGADYWTTNPLPEIGLRALRLADGPHGLRVQDDENPDHLGIGRSEKATCFPPAVTLASSWDPALVQEVGSALGREARSKGVDMVLGPGMNIKRSPLCGRNFEYLSEDPFFTGTMAAAMIRGIQSEGVAACVKHFAVNNQETDRLRVSADVAPRALREIYLRGFEIAVRDANPWGVMASYNRINGVFASENAWLLTSVLRDEWGYDGVVVSDWGAVHDPVAALKAGLDLRMPGRLEDPRIGKAAAAEEIDRELERTAIRLKLLADRTSRDAADPGDVDLDAHHRLTRRAAAESAVLLKNEQATLPLEPGAMKRLAVIGELARSPRYQGAGSSAVNPVRVVSALDALKERSGRSPRFEPGYRLDGIHDENLVTAAVAAAAAAETVVLFLGLPPEFESEGRDRKDISLPANQVAVLERLAAVNGRIVVVLSNGSVVTTAGWRDNAVSIVEFWLTGQAHGDSVADVLFGDVNPSGKLAETIPVRLEDTPSFLDFPGEGGHVLYGEGIFVGYRYFDARNMPVDYPFGHGLSYTTFEYSDLTVSGREADSPIAIIVSVRVKNTGVCAGAEVVQVYVGGIQESPSTPVRELKAFRKVHLEPGESAMLTFELSREELGHYSTAMDEWIYDGGPSTVYLGASSRDLRLSAPVDVPAHRVARPLTVWSTFGEWQNDPEAHARLARLIENRGGIRGRMADLLEDETGRASVLSFPLRALVEFPGFPVELDDVELLVSGSDHPKT
ncbi:glycosyl hydrolase [Arthrobacter nitrophenolicus]|uniref:Exo-alpha-(1->6)-L-arabinopyranosidase n=2 Tax=Arthrobacter nitrophenolicus TaxID=683150 RepID=A0A4R5XRV1_9MICC|nr:glycosyl hydrolase [Arthrobacter nitrophenolicus]